MYSLFIIFLWITCVWLNDVPSGKSHQTNHIVATGNNTCQLITKEALDKNELEEWILFMKQSSRKHIFNNISPNGSHPGCVVASPSRMNPDYYYYWVRDGALTMNTLGMLYAEATPGSAVGKDLEKKFIDYLHFVRRIIFVPKKSGNVGEPKFNVDGTAFSGDWGRPQNDGPPLQAITFMNFYHLYTQKGNQDPDILRLLYDGNLTSFSIIKTHLEHVAHNWHKPCFDLWEEVYGDHFWTEMMQRKALIMGAHFAKAMHDNAAASYYQKQIPKIEQAIVHHWNPSKKRIVENLRPGSTRSFLHKSSGLDVGTILAALRGRLGDHFFTPTDDRILSTAFQIIMAMKKKYFINQIEEENIGVSIGRYPEDVYDGIQMSQGNPWFLATNALSELLFVVGQTWLNQSYIQVTPNNKEFLLWLSEETDRGFPSFITSANALYGIILRGIQREGDKLLERIKKHIPETGRMAEQYHRSTGVMQGARDLTWSYSSMLEVIHQRELFRQMAPSVMEKDK